MNKEKNQILGLFLATLIFAFGCGSNEEGTANSENAKVYANETEMVAAITPLVNAIGLEDFRTLYTGEEYFILLDVRETPEYNAGFIPSAISIPRGVLEFRIGVANIWDDYGMYMPEKEDMLIVYCKKGSRSVLAAQSLQELGYTNIKFLEGGWLAWHEAFPVDFEQIETGSDIGGSAISSESSGGC